MECEKPGSTWPTCLAYMADGWITPTDLCPACTQAFMAALDGIAGPLPWHRDYRSRAAEGDGDTPTVTPLPDVT